MCHMLGAARDSHRPSFVVSLLTNLSAAYMSSTWVAIPLFCLLLYAILRKLQHESVPVAEGFFDESVDADVV